MISYQPGQLRPLAFQAYTLLHVKKVVRDYCGRSLLSTLMTLDSLLHNWPSGLIIYCTTRARRNTFAPASLKACATSGRLQIKSLQQEQQQKSL